MFQRLQGFPASDPLGPSNRPGTERRVGRAAWLGTSRAGSPSPTCYLPIAKLITAANRTPAFSNCNSTTGNARL